MIAASESVSMVPMMGNKPSMNSGIFKDENVGIAYCMGLTAEKVATQWKVSREAQDQFALASHQKAVAAQLAGEFRDEITPFEIVERLPNLAKREIDLRTRKMELDEGPRAEPRWKRWPLRQCSLQRLGYGGQQLNFDGAGALS